MIAALMWQFDPAMVDGHPVPAVIHIELTFSLR